jgi:hypothetical protein
MTYQLGPITEDCAIVQVSFDEPLAPGSQLVLVDDHYLESEASIKLPPLVKKMLERLLEIVGVDKLMLHENQLSIIKRGPYSWGGIIESAHQAISSYSLQSQN